MNEEDIKLYDALMEEINFNKTSKNYLVYRFVNNDFLESVFGIFPSHNIYYYLKMISRYKKNRKRIYVMLYD